MTDVLVRDVPDDVVAALEARAARLGLSRSEFLRRRLAQEATASAMSVSHDDLESFSATFADLADPEVMRGAWE
ncbi:MAG: ribbon-helix-helix protein, CopG family [Mycobacteriales bacterium]|nr:ribbon-helix-helix protein, CopG family [Mycobacteriales bacterium]